MKRYFDTQYLGRLLATADPRSWQSGQILWPILNFGLWHKYWIEGERLDDLVSPEAATA